ncbi:hypothetical protein BKD74_05920 [Corynebacterium diphtheriae]|nr:hypothetical protein BKD82_01840 [Corynebacterium diphtheriae]OFI63877.1 hypothetical protein BKD87_01840 [Corynebacterium diphtheriae]OJH94313.1 hypothetical protein BKD74_05920 [Corynebacterium diphtheriae]OSQ20309.1 hypothetical protein B1A54_01900 [Corynebacterium diphtheriae]
MSVLGVEGERILWQFTGCLGVSKGLRKEKRTFFTIGIFVTWVTFTVKDLWCSTHKWMGAVLQV